MFFLCLNAAILAFSVAPTEILGNLIFAPLTIFASAIIYPFLIFIFAPNFFKAKSVDQLV